MAKRIIDWEMKVDGNLVMREYMGGENLGIEIARFDLNKLFPKYKEMNEVQRFVVVYGVKQKLADAGAMMKTAKEKAETAKEKFADFCEGKVERVRVATAKADKATVAKVKDVLNSKVVSLEQLILKKTLHPEAFTEEEQVKLNELILASAELEARVNLKKK